MTEDNSLLYHNASKLWAEMKDDILQLDATGEAMCWVDSEVSIPSGGRDPPSPSSETLLCVPRDRLHKVSKNYQHAIAQFRDLVEARRPSEQVQAAAQEVALRFGEVLEIMVQMRRGASQVLREELFDVAVQMAEATIQLGMPMTTPDTVRVNAGMALDACKNFERVSVHNRAAARRRINSSLAKFRDLDDQLTGALHHPGALDQLASEDEDLDLGDNDRQELEPQQRIVVEAVAGVVDVMGRILEEASQACLPSGSTPTNAATPADTVAALEEVALQATIVARCAHGLTANSIADLDQPALRAGVSELAAGVQGIRAAVARCTTEEVVADLHGAMDRLQGALAAMPS